MHSTASTLPLPVNDARTNLIGLPREDWAAAFAELGLEAYRVRQVWHWVYFRGVTDFADMSTIAKPARERLAERFTLERPQAVRDLTSIDETRKWLVRLPDGNLVETVYIPDIDELRGALCMSSQVGCTLTCAFCHTGTQKLVRNLTAGEIVGQFMLARDCLGEWPEAGRNPNTEERRLSNIVMMGMGEPLFNYDQVAQALGIIMDAEGLALSKRRITLSTSGVVPMMERCGNELGVNLAVSLHAVTDELRDVLVPLNKKWPIAELLDACRKYPGSSNARRITFEYVMLKGINDSDADAHALTRLLKGIPAKVNLIPFNPWPGTVYECSSNNRVRAFADILLEAGLAAPVRTPRGRDIGAACGQLKSDSVRQKRASEQAA